MTNQTPQHTPEPWHVGINPGPIIYDTKYGSQVSRMDQPFGQTDEENKANAERIVTCVNACAGIANPETLPDIVETLRVALKDASQIPEHVSSKILNNALNELTCQVKDALAKLESNQ